MTLKGPEMDVSDLKLLQTIYYILNSSYSFRRQMSAYEFRSFLIAELRKQNIRVEIINEEHPLFSVNKKVILFFPDSKKDERQIQTILLEFLITYAKLLYCHPLARCFQAGAITIIITAAAGGCIITIIMVIAAIITITTAIAGNHGKGWYRAYSDLLKQTDFL